MFLLCQLSPDSGALLVTYPVEGVQQPVHDTSVTSVFSNSKVCTSKLIYLLGTICGCQCICSRLTFFFWFANEDMLSSNLSVVFGR